MRKLLAALAAITAAVLAMPALASAADYTYEGGCHVSGVAKFGSPLVAQQAPNTYDFMSGKPDAATADTTDCTGTLNGVAVTDAPAVVAVRGQGNLSCAQSQSTEPPGGGTLTFSDSGITLGFTLAFVAFGTEVALTVKGASAGEGRGRASFAAYTGNPAETVQKCETTGIESLGFDADFRSLSALKSPAAAPGGGGGGTTGGGGGGGGSTGSGPSGGGGSQPVASVVSLRTLAQRLRTALRRGVAATLRGNVPAKATLRAQVDAATARRYRLRRGGSRKPLTVGRGTINLTRPGSTRGYVKLNRAARRRLRNARRVRVRLVGTILDVTQRRRAVKRTVLLR